MEGDRDDAEPAGPGPAPTAGAVTNDKPGSASTLTTANPTASGRINPTGIRRAVRVFWLSPLVLAVGLWSGNSAATSFAVFGTIACLVMADFGGPLPARFGAYLQLAIFGAALAAVGTALSGSTVVAVVGTLVIIFVVQFAGVFGGYPAAGGTSVSLAFLLAVLTPAPIGETPARMVGWLIGCTVAGATAVLLWPLHEKQQFREDTARLCRSVAKLVRHGADQQAAPAPEDAATDPVGTEVRSARNQVQALLERFGSTPYRPAGPSIRDQALLAVMDRLDIGVEFLATTRMSRRHQFGRGDEGADIAHADPPPGVEDPDIELRQVVEDTLDRTADLLDGSGGQPDVTRLGEARQRNRQAHHQLAATLVDRGEAYDEAIAFLDRSFPLRVLSYLAVAVAGNAMVACGHRVGDDTARAIGLIDDDDAGSKRLARVGETLRIHLRLSDVWFRNSVRAAIAIAAAVGIADLVDIPHAFWVALATLSALRSNGLGTNTTAIQAVAGNLIGFVIAALLVVAVGDHQGLLWVVLPVVLFATAYAPGSFGPITGQAAFAVTVVVLFNIISPAGVITAVERVEAVALGAAVGTVAALVMWPRGAKGLVGSSLADLMRSSARYLAAGYAAFTAQPEEVEALGAVAEQARVAATADRSRMVTSLSQLLTEHGGHRGPRAATEVMRVMAVPDAVALAAEATRVLPTLGYAVADCGGCRTAVAAHTTALMGAIDASADQLEGRPPIHPTLPDLAVVESSLHRCLDELAADAGPDELRPAIGLVFSIDWLRDLDDGVSHLDEPVRTLRAELDRPWWR